MGLESMVEGAQEDDRRDMQAHANAAMQGDYDVQLRIEVLLYAHVEASEVLFRLDLCLCLRTQQMVRRETLEKEPA